MTREEAAAIVAAMECASPAYGAPGHAHCAACCYGVGLAPASQEEADLLNEALVVLGERPIDWARVVEGPGNDVDVVTGEELIELIKADNAAIEDHGLGEAPAVRAGVL